VQFIERLFAAIRRVQNPVVVGIDPRPEELPPGFLERFPETRQGVAEALRQFGADIIDIIAPMVAAVKFQSAFYEAYGPAGVAALHATIEDARSKGLIVIVDGKRNDIGSTADAYARAYLGKVPVGGRYEPSWSADALTVNPYFGSDGVLPFVRTAAREHKGVFVLIRTSNVSAGEFQDLVADGQPLYRHVADRLRQWAEPYKADSGYSLVGAVVGATYPGQLAELRGALPGVPFLVPGYGSQGATSKDVAPAFDENGLGALVNNSRGITGAYDRSPYRSRFGDRWQAAVEQAVRDMIEDLAAHTSAGRLRSAPVANDSGLAVS
jgi:orotidine-5'-phosphate decarboxylase